MKVYYGLTPSEGTSAVALGNFDGLHLGHRKVIGLAVAEAKAGLVPTVLTFSENPLRSLVGEAGGRILTGKEKVSLLEGMGVGQLYILDFDSIRDMTAEKFVEEILIKVCRARMVCCGFNFTFGRGGKAGSADLKRLCSAKGIAASVAPAVLVDGTPVSSTRIRGLIENGRVDQAERLLGRPFGYESPVLHGRHLGHQLGTPTLNQAVPDGFVCPRFGVYASAVRLESGEEFFGVTNVGVKPTVGSDAVLAETWMPEYRGADLYGRTVRVDLLRFLRPERRFSGLDELKAEIEKNGREAREFYRTIRHKK